MSSAKKTADLLTMCFKAGKAVKGFDSAVEALKDGSAYSIMTAADASEKTIKEAGFYCRKYGKPHIPTELSKADIGRLCGKETAVIAVCDKGFTEGFLKILK